VEGILKSGIMKLPQRGRKGCLTKTNLDQADAILTMSQSIFRLFESAEQGCGAEHEEEGISTNDSAHPRDKSAKARDGAGTDGKARAVVECFAAKPAPPKSATACASIKRWSADITILKAA